VVKLEFMRPASSHQKCEKYMSNFTKLVIGLIAATHAAQILLFTPMPLSGQRLYPKDVS
jgi:hypothetical protein